MTVTVMSRSSWRVQVSPLGLGLGLRLELGLQGLNDHRCRSCLAITTRWIWLVPS